MKNVIGIYPVFYHYKSMNIKIKYKIFSHEMPRHASKGNIDGAAKNAVARSISTQVMTAGQS